MWGVGGVGHNIVCKMNYWLLFYILYCCLSFLFSVCGLLMFVVVVVVVFFVVFFGGGVVLVFWLVGFVCLLFKVQIKLLLETYWRSEVPGVWEDEEDYT